MVDFGLSKLIDVKNFNTQKKTSVGTPQYMASEIIKEGGGWGEKSDIWSLGVLLYYMLFKSIPWVKSNEYI